jgi:hypothetical protein
VNTGVADAPIAGYLFLDTPSSVTLGIVEMQTQLAMADSLQLLSMPVANGRITLLMKYATVKDVSCVNKFTMASCSD